MKSRFVLIVIILFVVTQSFSQSADQIEKYKQGSEELISFLEYIFNAMGDPNLPVSDKDVIVNESYLKAFANSEVQVEDDLIAQREVVTNKDVQAYLKDIDFFFKGVNFELRIEEITEGINENGDLFLRVKLNRHMQGVDIKGDSINNSLTRFVEINVDQKQNDLKIASVYTTKVGKTEELVRWWVQLSPAWKNLLGKKFEVGDAYRLNDVSVLNDSTFFVGGQKVDNKVFNIPEIIRQATEITELDLSTNKEINEIQALNELTELKKLNISNTRVSSLFPLRNLTTLEALNCSYTLIDDLEPLKYCIGLKELDISNTNIRNIQVLQGFPKMQVFKADNSQVDSTQYLASCQNLTTLSLENNQKITEIEFLSGLSKLTFLNLSGTSISDISQIGDLKNVENLSLSNTSVKDLNPIAGLEKLDNLSVVNTQVDDISNLKSLKISKIYCDGSQLDKGDIVDFLLANPETDIIFQTEELESWWGAMPTPWKNLVFSKLNLEGEPTPEVLHQLIRIRKVNISGKKEIDDLAPLEKVLFLEELNCAKTSVSDLTPLASQNYLKEINISATKVADISPLSHADSLEKIIASSTDITNIEPLKGLTKLSHLNFDSTSVQDVSTINSLPSFKIAYFDHTLVTDDEVVELDYEGEDAIVVYKTDHLFEWWGHLDDEWQDMFRKSLDFEKVPTREEIHKLTGLKKFVVKSILISDISIMQEFIRLRELKFNDTQVKSLNPLVKMKKLEVLDCSRNPIEELTPLAALTNLKSIYADNTQIDEIDPLENLTNLEELTISNTEVKDLRPVENLTKLRVLEFSNTRVKNIKPLLGLPNIEVLKCFNNSINSKWIDEFKALHPNSEVIFY